MNIKQKRKTRLYELQILNPYDINNQTTVSIDLNKYHGMKCKKLADLRKTARALEVLDDSIRVKIVRIYDVGNIRKEK